MVSTTACTAISRYIANGPLAGSPEFGNGNIFNTGKAAMGLTQTWYTCCLGDTARRRYRIPDGHPAHERRR